MTQFFFFRNGSRVLNINCISFVKLTDPTHAIVYTNIPHVGAEAQESPYYSLELEGDDLAALLKMLGQ